MEITTAYMLYGMMLGSIIASGIILVGVKFIVIPHFKKKYVDAKNGGKDGK